LTITELAMENRDVPNQCIITKDSENDLSEEMTITTTIDVSDIQKEENVQTQTTTTSTTTTSTAKPPVFDEQNEIDDLKEEKIDEKLNARPKKNVLKPESKPKTKPKPIEVEEESGEDKDSDVCIEDHCHNEDSNEILEVDDDEEEDQVYFRESFGSLAKRPGYQMSMADRMNFARGPQINIENLHLDLSTKHILQVYDKLIS
jgi:hypothetical protein